MSSPSSSAVQNLNEEPKTSNASGSNILENPFSLKRRSFNPPPTNSDTENQRPSDNAIESSHNGSIDNNSNPESSNRVTSVANNKDVDVSSSDAVSTHSNEVVSSSDAAEVGADSTVNQPDSTTYQQTGNASSSVPRVVCRYAEKCYRRNNTHREIFAHPGDSDYKVKPTNSANPNLLIVPNDNAPECRFGQLCYRKNPEHFRNKKHSHTSNTGRPKRRKTTANSPTSSNVEVSSDSDEDEDFSGDDDEDYVPPDSE